MLMAITRDEMNQRLALARTLWAELSSRQTEFSSELDNWNSLLKKVEDRLNFSMSTQAPYDPGYLEKDLRTLDDAISRFTYMKAQLERKSGGGTVVYPEPSPKPTNGWKTLPVAAIIGVAAIGAAVFFLSRKGK